MSLVFLLAPAPSFFHSLTILNLKIGINEDTGYDTFMWYSCPFLLVSISALVALTDFKQC